jgi:hypothetical protein
MPDEGPPADARLRALEARLDRLEQRLARLEGRSMPPVVPDGAAAPAEAAPEPAPHAGDWGLAPVVSLGGRTLIAIGGAYLLRALTEAGSLPLAPGVGIGFAYAAACAAAAARAGGSHPASATFHGAAAAAIAFPLVFEATARFALLPPGISAAALALTGTVLVAIAWWHALHGLAWITVAAAAATGLATMATTGQAVAGTAALIELGIVTLWVSYERDWYAIRWPVAAVADFAVVGVTARAAGAQALDNPLAAIAVQVLLLGGYLGSIAARTLGRGRRLIPFEAIQGVTALVIGLGGALLVTRARGAGALPLGLATALLGFGSYAAALAFAGRRGGSDVNFTFYASLGLGLLLSAATLLAGGMSLVLALGLLAAAALALGRARQRQVLGAHAVVYLWAAALAAGVATAGAGSLLGLLTPVPAPPGTVLVVLLAALACRFGRWPAPAGAGFAAWGALHVLVDLILVAAAGWLVLGLVAPLFVGSAGALATARTIVLSLAAVSVAWAGRFARCAELRWLAAPLLVVTGIKLVLEDFSRSSASTFFVSLAVYGAALIAGTRLVQPGSAGAPR